ncbi:MAG: EAL domain-containing protein, partial [Pseudomonadota bacterium]
MTVFLFIVYMALGGGAGWALSTYAGQSLPISVLGGVATTLVLGQIHLFARSPRARLDESEARLGKIEKEQVDVDRRMNVVEARTDAVETTVKHELTERRDALVSEMRQLEGLIDRLSRNFETRLSETETGIVRPQEDATLRAVKGALMDGRVDLHLQPVVSLPQRRVAFYEGFTRLRDPDGSLILPASFLDAARRANLMGVIDNMTLFRCVQIVRRLAERDRRVGVFCNISTSSLEDDQFFPHFLDFMRENQDLSGAMIFEIRADRFETRSRKMRENMDMLTSLGFRFSID